MLRKRRQEDCGFRVSLGYIMIHHLRKRKGLWVSEGNLKSIIEATEAPTVLLIVSHFFLDFSLGHSCVHGGGRSEDVLLFLPFVFFFYHGVFSAHGHPPSVCTLCSSPSLALVDIIVASHV